MSRMFDESRRVRCSITRTSGLSALSVIARRLGLRHADAVVGVQDLTLQVRQVDDVVVDDARACRRRPPPGKTPPASRGRPRRGTAPSRRAACLARLAHLGEQEVAAVARQLLARELNGPAPRGSRRSSTRRSRRVIERRRCSPSPSGCGRRAASGCRSGSTRSPGVSCRAPCPRPASRGSRAAR